MLLLGIDIGTSSVKVSVTDPANGSCLASATCPETESGIIAVQPGWAEQSPEMWWEHTQQAILKCHQTRRYDPADIGAIGIAYQMHGLVIVDRHQNVLRNSIIWCDSRAVEIGNQADNLIGPERCRERLLNSPGNFTASKLLWVKENEADIYNRIWKVMLPGDFISMKLTGEVTTSISALSEGVFWDFKSDELSRDIMEHFGFDRDLIPEVRPVFGEHGRVRSEVAKVLELKSGVPVTYKAGDQPNNALSLNVLRPGEVAANGGTSGVIYGVTDRLVADQQSRVNTFAHVNYTPEEKRLGVLLCINGTGIMNRWIKNLCSGSSYDQMNADAALVPAGSQGLRVIPFGNGAERILNNRNIGAHFQNLDLNIHGPGHVFRAAQEGIAFSFRYGLDIMRENGITPAVVRAGRTNMFSSTLFGETFSNICGTPLEMYGSDGSIGAATGAGIGAGVFETDEAFNNLKKLGHVDPQEKPELEEGYLEWKELLISKLAN